MTLSHHANVRARQRGISPAQLSAIAIHGDMEVRRSGSCHAKWISKETLRCLGPVTPEGVPIDRLKGLTILQAEDDTLVTAFRNAHDKVYRRSARRNAR
jgi:hypothetical protein